MSTIRECTEKSNKAIQEISTRNITKTNLLIYATAAVKHRKLHPWKNTKRIEQNKPHWQIRKTEKTPAAQNTDTHPFPPYTTWLSAETLDIHCTADNHRRHCCRLLKKKAGSPNSARRARSDSSIRQCGPSTTAGLCLQHQNTGNNPPLALQLYAKQTSQSSFSATRIQKRKGEKRSGTMRSSVSSTLQLLSGRLSYTALDWIISN